MTDTVVIGDKTFTIEDDMAKPLEDAPQEVAPVDPAQAFDEVIKKLLYYEHRIEDITRVATRFIADARARYNHTFEANKPFLREHAIEHLKRGKDGEIKGKSYKTISSGGGVFFRAKPEKITINYDNLHAVKKLLLGYLDDAQVNALIPEKITYEVPEKDTLVEALCGLVQQTAKDKLQEFVDANGEFASNEEREEQFIILIKQGEDEIFNEDIITVEQADPFHYCFVGSSKGFTGGSIKQEIIRAVDGKQAYDAEEEVDILLEDLG